MHINWAHRHTANKQCQVPDRERYSQRLIFMNAFRFSTNSYDDLYLAVSGSGLVSTVLQRGTRVASIEQVGGLVRAERMLRGFDQVALAKLAQVGRRFVSDLERGKPTIHAAQMFDVLAALDTRVVLKRSKPKI